MRIRTRSLVALCGLLLSTEAHAETGGELRYNLPLDLTVTGAFGVGWVASEIWKEHITPSACRWCDRNADGSDGLNAVDAAVRKSVLSSDPSAANRLSNVTGFLLAPVAGFGLDAVAAAADHRFSGYAVDALVIGQAVVVAAGVNQTVKFLAARERPHVHARTAPDGLVSGRSSRADADGRLSFYSGHTTLGFSVAVASGTVASMRGYPLAPVVWATGLAVGVTTGYLRIAADYHYFTDVLTGAIVGSAIGFALPYLLHRPNGQVPEPGTPTAPFVASFALPW